MEPALCPGIIFCDAIIREEGTRKLSVIGAFQIYNAPVFPFNIPGFAVLVMVDNLKRGTKELKVTIRLESKDSGFVLGSSFAQIALAEGYDPRGSLDIPFRFHPISFPHPGEFQVTVLVNNEEVGNRRLVVNSLTSQNPSGSK